MTADLAVSKSSASVAARLLEKYRLTARHGERVLYERWYAGRTKPLLDELAELLEIGAGNDWLVSGNSAPTAARKQANSASLDVQLSL
jgi:hypothetical protein